MSHHLDERLRYVVSLRATGSHTERKFSLLQTRNFVDPLASLIMFATAILAVFYMTPLFDCSIFIYKSEDSSSVQDYDCVDHQSMPYCRRPLQPMPLQRDSETPRCYHNGISHSFRSLRSDNITVHTILQHWKSTIDKVDEYARYLRQPTAAEEGETQLCECIEPRSFGKNCEYLLPSGNTFADVVDTKFSITSGKLMYVGEIVCYTTLKCNFGLLCLDWRDICDGQQQCMSGLDEENCDKLEFNECEDDEYRCMNGMCIPDEYFLDGDYDCMDMSDEKELFDDTQCPHQSASVECDDRVCSPSRWSCGDGQCIVERFDGGNVYRHFLSCLNRRDQLFWCERATDDNLWSEPNGRCTRNLPDVTSVTKNYCAHLLLCASSERAPRYCICEHDASLCTKMYQDHCSTFGLVPYPAGGLITPYAFQYFKVTHNSSLVSSVSILNGTIKCRGYLIRFTRTVSDTDLQMSLMYIESFICKLASERTNTSHDGYHRHCHNDSRTFNNRSYHWFDVCERPSNCISAYRVNDGFANCRYQNDEAQTDKLVLKSCSRVQRHRFRCSMSQVTCRIASVLTVSFHHCKSIKDTLSRGIQVAISRARCNSQLKTDCSVTRRLIEFSWNHTLYNYTDLQRSQFKKLPFRSYCDTFQDSPSDDDERSTLCQSLWTCSSEEWQCHTGQCIDIKWVLDNEWDCPDGSDEDTIFAVDFSESHPNRKWLRDSSFIDSFKELYEGPWFRSICNAAITYGCLGTEMLQSTNCSEPCGKSLSTVASPSVCVSDYSVDYAFVYCFRTLMALGEKFQCSSINTSSFRPFVFRKQCPMKRDNNENGKTSTSSVTCWDGTIKSRVPCTHVVDYDEITA